VIRQVTAFGDACKKKHGTRLFYCADEFYIRAGLPLPEEDYYEEYSQIENGVGMITSLCSEFDVEMKYLDEYLPKFTAPRTVSIATGMAAFDTLHALAKRLERAVEGLTVHVYPIQNHFFGESVTVAGLLTGKDVSEQLRGQVLGDELLYPSVMLKADEEIFLDDMTPTMLSECLGVPVRPVKSDGAELICAILGIDG
jgi:NifB/MoaA-like Fe-S oxidoreductase